MSLEFSRDAVMKKLSINLSRFSKEMEIK